MTKVKTCYNLELLLECRERSDALDLWIPEDKITRDSKIKFICSCGNLYKTGFRYIFRSGMKCLNCKIEISQKLMNEKNMEKYGVKHPSQLESVKEKKRLKNLKTLGVEYSFQSKEIKQKTKETNLEKYGVENPFQSEQVKQKIKETNLEKYGFEYPNQTNEVKQKIQESCKKYWMDKYGVENAIQVPEFFEKSQRNSRRLKSYSFPSGKEVKIQGYERYALNLLIKSYTEEDIIVGSGLVPEIFYDYENKIKRYFTDIYIPKNNLMIEVKSIYTMECDIDINLAKRKACLEQGFDFQFWIFDKKQNLQIINKDQEYIHKSK